MEYYKTEEQHLPKNYKKQKDTHSHREESLKIKRVETVMYTQKTRKKSKALRKQYETKKHIYKCHWVHIFCCYPSNTA